MLDAISPKERVFIPQPLLKRLWDYLIEPQQPHYLETWLEKWERENVNG
jgi:hypothetical protein